jgi:hypothetical protein
MTTPFTSAIGPIVTGRDVELAALRMLKRWSSTYLAEAERQTGRTVGSLPRVRAWTTAPDFEKWPEDQLPCVLLISPGLAEPPNVRGTGNYRARFSLGIAVIVSAARMDDTAALAKLYCATLRACLLQHQSLEGFAAGVTWLDENYDDLPSIDDRSLGAGQAIFAVEVDGISTRWNGPTSPDSEPPEPPTDPIPADPTAERVVVTEVPIPIA